MYRKQVFFWTIWNLVLYMASLAGVLFFAILLSSGGDREVEVVFLECDCTSQVCDAAFFNNIDTVMSSVFPANDGRCYYAGQFTNVEDILSSDHYVFGGLAIDAFGAPCKSFQGSTFLPTFCVAGLLELRSGQSSSFVESFGTISPEISRTWLYENCPGCKLELQKRFGLQNPLPRSGNNGPLPIFIPIFVVMGLNMCAILVFCCTRPSSCTSIKYSTFTGTLLSMLNPQDYFRSLENRTSNFTWCKIRFLQIFAVGSVFGLMVYFAAFEIYQPAPPAYFYSIMICNIAFLVFSVALCYHTRCHEPGEIKFVDIQEDDRLAEAVARAANHDDDNIPLATIVNVNVN